LIAEGALDRDLFLVMEGEVRMRRGALDLGPAAPGELLGELALVEERPRSATVVAETPVVVARLSHAAFERMSEQHPAVALRLTRHFVKGLGRRLRSLTDDLQLLLHERSLPRRRRIQARMEGASRWVRTGTPAGALLPPTVDGEPVVAALIDQRAVTLSTPLTADCTVGALTTGHWEGRRIYRQSLGTLLLEATATVAPTLDLRLDHSIGVGLRVRVHGPEPMDAALVEAIEAEMRRLVAVSAPLHEEWWTRDEAAAYFGSTRRPHVAELLRTRQHATVRLATYGEVFTLATGPMLPTTAALGDFGLIHDDGDLVLLYGRRGTGEGTPDAPHPEEAARQRARDAREIAGNAALRLQARHAWLGALHLQSIGRFNQHCIDGSVAGIIHVSEGAQEKRIGRIADGIASRADTVKVVCIAGPSSSGKTTFIKRLRVQLQVNGIEPIGLSLDDYFCDREDTPRDASGDYDFEAFEALRTDLLATHLERV
ncbi:MAG: cyclic nucleotide-binding domain-containing protein, partial [Myxococcales bacterium]|nr:cyclic nucleotide-binding domain-containing protein [Myxococcales bacterium]